MAVEGLQVVLDKEPVVGTPTADQFLSAPEAIDARFVRHVRSYVPFGDAGGAGDEGLSISAYEKRLIELVKEAAAPKGYISAEYGYGKTSTALFLWHRCREAGLLAVPPFQLGMLEDLILATYGWARYELGRRAPGLVARTDDIYRSYSERSIETDAGGDAQVAARLRELLAAGRYGLTLNATDYVTFFEQVCALGEEAGFGGLVILPDEVQQYVESASRAGTGDPIPPLHNIVEALVTRRGRLRVGLVFSVPAKELGAINDRRGDLVQRLKMDRLGLDLGTVYDKRFAKRLWGRLATEFAFSAEADRIVDPATLDGLGQISARDDLANGPRTTIAAFKHMVRRYLDSSGEQPPFGPIDLVEAFLAGAIPFDATSKLQRTVNEHLATPFLAERPAARQVVKLLAAFPTDGAPPEVVRANGLWEAAQELQRLTQGDVVLTVGGGRDDQGREVPFALALRGLEPTTGIASDWLTSTLREFSRYHVDTSDKANERAERAFARLLTAVIFREPHWKVVERVERRLTDSPDLLLEGSFPGTARRFPERRVHVRLLRDGEVAKGTREADFTFDIVLGRHFDRDEAERRGFPGTLVRDDGRSARLELNLFHRASEQYYADLQANLQPVMNPWRVSPLLMLALHEAIEEKRRGQLVPKEDDREIEHVFQPALFEHSADEMLNAELGAEMNARGPRIFEELFRALCEERYPSYRTVMLQQGWPTRLLAYGTALERLDDRYQRQGEADHKGTKDEIARLFNGANTALDSFVTTFSDLIAVTPPFRGREASAVRFRLHPFEERVRELVRKGKAESVRVGGQTLSVHVVPLSLVNHAGDKLGYRPREVSALLEVMEKRGLIEVSPQRNEVREVAHPALNADELARQVDAFIGRVATLLATFPDEPTLTTHAQTLRQVQQELAQQRQKLDEQKLVLRSNIVRQYDRQLGLFLQHKQESLRQAAREMAEAPNIDPATPFKLREPITETFFGPALDVVRDKLLEQADALRARADAVKTRALEVLSELRADVPTDDQISRAHADLATLREQARRVSGELGILEARCGQLATAKHALQQAIDLDHQLTLTRVGQDDGPDLGGALETLVRAIQAGLSRHKASAIEQASSWEADLTALRTRLSRLQSEQIDAFEERKGRYLELLRRYAHIPADSVPLRATFNPRDPDGSRRMLAAEVARVLAQGLERPVVLLEQWGEGLRHILASGDLAYVDDPNGQEQLCRNLLREVMSRTAAMIATRREIDDDAVVEDAATDEGRFVRFMRGYEAIAVDVARLGSRYQTLAATVRTRRLDPHEETFMDALGRSVDGDRPAIDLGAVFADPAAFGVASADEVWSAVQGLYKKRRIGVRLAVTDWTEA